MKTTKLITLLCIALFFSCTKEKVGPAGPPGANGQQSKTFEFALTFDTYNRQQPYTLFPHYSESDGVIVYMLTSIPGTPEVYTVLPYLDATTGFYYFPQIMEDGRIWINVSSNTVVPLMTKYFKATLVKGEQI